MNTPSFLGILLTAILVFCPTLSKATVKVVPLSCAPTLRTNGTVEVHPCITYHPADVLTAEDVTPQFNAILSQVKDLQQTTASQASTLNSITNRNSDEDLKRLVREIVQQVLKDKNIN